MASITKLKTTQSIRNFEPEVALNLVQAFHRQLELQPLLELFFAQVQAVVQAVGVCYRNPDRNIDLLLGEEGRHTASYNLSYQEEKLGELVCHFRSRVTEESLETAEDLITLAMAAVRNALRYRAATEAGTARELPGDLTLTPGGNDSLVLVRLDGHAEILERDGEAWAQTLLKSVQGQLSEGLRAADAVYQIDRSTLAVVLPHTPVERARDVAGKLRVLIASLHLRDGDVSQQLTACMGIASTRAARSAEEVLGWAREALESAEREGSNTVAAHPLS
jgi:diguanylate cyclase (GGDEF)-like protein